MRAIFKQSLKKRKKWDWGGWFKKVFQNRWLDIQFCSKPKCYQSLDLKVLDTPFLFIISIQVCQFFFQNLPFALSFSFWLSSLLAWICSFIHHLPSAYYLHRARPLSLSLGSSRDTQQSCNLPISITRLQALPKALYFQNQQQLA